MAWPARVPTGKPATPERPFDDLHPEEAETLRQWLMTQPEYAAAYRDGAHPDHGKAVADMTQLHEIASAAGADAGEGAAPAGEQVTAEMAEARAAIRAKEGDEAFMKAYRDKFDPGHAEAMREMTALYAKAYPEAPSKAAPASSSTGGGSDTRGAAVPQRRAPRPPASRQRLPS